MPLERKDAFVWSPPASLTLAFAVGRCECLHGVRSTALNSLQGGSGPGKDQDERLLEGGELWAPAFLVSLLLGL